MSNFEPEAIDEYLEYLDLSKPYNATLNITHSSGVYDIPVVWWGQYIDDDYYIAHQIFNEDISDVSLKITLNDYPEICCTEFIYNDNENEELITKIPLYTLLEQHNIVGKGDPYNFGDIPPEQPMHSYVDHCMRMMLSELTARANFTLRQDLKTRDMKFECSMSELIEFTREILLSDFSNYDPKTHTMIEDEDDESLDVLFSIWGVDRNDPNFDIDDCPGDR